MSALCAPAVHVGGGGPLPLRLDLRQPAISHPHQDPAVSCSVSVRLSRVVAVTAESFDDGRTDVPGGITGPVERVVVVGAGIAGLTVANALARARTECVVLEARD